MKEICESAEDSILDLIDYCHRKLTLLAARSTKAQAVTSAELRDEGLASPSSMQVRRKSCSSLGTRVVKNVGSLQRHREAFSWVATPAPPAHLRGCLVLLCASGCIHPPPLCSLASALSGASASLRLSAGRAQSSGVGHAGDLMGKIFSRGVCHLLLLLEQC